MGVGASSVPDAKNAKQIYEELVARGYPKKDAAKEAQARTGMSLVTGRQINRQIPSKESYAGEYKQLGQYKRI